jgi:hypothetical protein
MEETKDIKDAIKCVGVDDRIHYCYPWEDKTLCGVKVKEKTVKKQDYTKRFWCYECTF